MGRNKPYYVQVRLTEHQAEEVASLIEDYLEEPDEDDAAVPSLNAARKAIDQALNRLDYRLKLMDRG